MNPTAVVQLIAKSMGFGFVCRICVKLWRGLSAGHGECTSSVMGKPCSGPIKNGGFPEYEGPLDGKLVNFCFVCGRPSDFAAVTQDGLVGVCDKHIDMLRTYSSDREKPAFISGENIEVKE